MCARILKGNRICVYYIYQTFWLMWDVNICFYFSISLNLKLRQYDMKVALAMRWVLPTACQRARNDNADSWRLVAFFSHVQFNYWVLACQHKHWGWWDCHQLCRHLVIALDKQKSWLHWWLLQMKSYKIRVISLHPEGNMKVCTKFHRSSSNNYCACCLLVVLDEV